MTRFSVNTWVLFCTLTAAMAIMAMVPVHAETPPPAQVVASASLDKQQLKSELEELEAEVERVRRTQGEAGLHRRGLKRKLAEKQSFTDFHLQLIERLERIEQRLNALETRAGGR